MAVNDAQQVDAILQLLGVEKGTLVASAVGALISMRFFDSLAWWQRWLTALGGWATALFMTPGVIRFFDLAVSGWAGSIGFLIGLFGMALAGALFKALDDIRAVNWGEQVKGWLSRKGGGQ